MPNEVTTVVQNGETLSLYGRLYDVSAKDIKTANGIKGDNLNTGKKIVIPIGQKKPEETCDDEYKKLNYIGQKMKGWEYEIKEKKALLANPNLSEQEREKIEQECITLINKQDLRKKAANVQVSEDKKYVTLNINEGMSAAELKALYNIETGALRDFLDKNGRIPFINGKGFVPDKANIESGDKITIPISSYNYLGFTDELMHKIGLND